MTRYLTRLMRSEKWRVGVFAFFVVVSMTTSSRVQAGEEEKKTWHSPFFSPKVGNLYFLGGAGFYDLDPLNDALDDNGYSELKYPALSLGVGTDMSIGRLILGAEWHWLKNVGTEADRDNLRADISSKYWLARIGVDLAHWRGLRVYPLLGVGMGTTSISIADEEGASFENVLETPGREVSMSQKGLLVDASFGIDYRFKMKETQYKSSFVTFGLRGGYLFSPYSGKWKSAAAEISNGPDILTSGPTVQLLIGFSGERKKHRECCKK